MGDHLTKKTLSSTPWGVGWQTANLTSKIIVGGHVLYI